MPQTSNAWTKAVADNAALRFVDINLRGTGQVIFQNNPLTGLLFLIAICWGAVAARQPATAIGAVIALLVATSTAMLLDVDEISLRQGLFGFNGVLVGAALPTFLSPSPAMWAILVIGAAVSTIVMQAVSNVMKTWGTPALTFPFVLTTWFLVLGAYSFGHLPIAAMAPPALPHAIGPGSGWPDPMALLRAWLKGPAQVFLINNWVSGILVVLGLLVSSRWAALFALAGCAVALGASLAFGASLSAIEAGLYGFSPVLTAIGLGCVFYTPSLRVAAFALLATLFTVLVQGAMDAAVAPLGIPTFTAPFVFVTWLFLLPKAQLVPHPHGPVDGGVMHKRAPTAKSPSSTSTAPTTKTG